MASKNDVVTHVRVAVGGVEVTKKNLDAIRLSAENTGKAIAGMKKELQRLADSGDIKGAAELTKEINRQQNALKNTRKMLASWEREVNSYVDVLQNLSGATVGDLNRAARDLQAQMKQTLTANDTQRWKQLNEAYREVMRTMDQLSGKVPNLNYVMQNLGKVSNQSLAQTSAYLRQLVQDTDRTTERGRKAVSQWTDELKQVQAEQAARAQKAMAEVQTGPFTGTPDEAQQVIEELKQYRDSLSIGLQADEINQVTQAISRYTAALNSVKETVVDVQRVLADPQAYGVREIEEAIKVLEENGKEIKVGDEEAIRANREEVEKLRKALDDARFASQNIDRIVSQAEGGAATISDMERAVRVLNERLAATPVNQSQEIERIRQQLDRLNPALAAARNTVANVRNVLGNLDSAPLNSLREAAKALKEQMESVGTDTREFIEASRNLDRVKARIKELEGGASKLEKAFDRLKNWVLVYAGFSELWDRTRQMFTGNLTLSDQMSDVRKTTGLAAGEVQRLADEIQELDTRVNNEKLMATAAEAGRIGLSSREDVLGFVKASAITLTALEELDEKAISSVMKLNDLLGETKRLGVEQAILSTASSINELSQASAAAPEPIINFSRRFGGIARQANISTAEVLAMGATLDALAQPIEMSSTAMNKFTTALLSNGKVIAQDTGLSEDYYNSMIKQGRTVELMIEVLSRLNNMGGLQDISKYMKDMGSDGARMTQIISTMAASLPQLRENLELANSSFREGTSVITEYNVKNENAAAYMERIGNIIREVFVNSTAESAITFWLSQLHRLITFMTEGSVASRSFNAVITMLFGSIIGHLTKANVRLLEFFSVLKAGFLSAVRGTVSFTGAIKGLSGALKGLIAHNPVGWLVLIVSYLPEVVSWFSRTKDSIRETGDIAARVAQHTKDAAYYIQAMRADLDRASRSTENYADIIARLNLDYKEYLGHLVSESAGYREIAAAIDVAAAAQRRRIIQEERDNVQRTVNDKYRNQSYEIHRQLYQDVVTDNGVLGSAGEDIAQDFYQAIIEGVRKNGKTGELELSTVLQEMIANQARVFADAELDTEGSHIAERYGHDRERIIEAYETTLTNRIRRMDSVREMAEMDLQKTAEVNVAVRATEAQLSKAVSEEIKLRKEELSVIEDEKDFFGKEAKNFTQADEDALSHLIKGAQHTLQVMQQFGASVGDLQTQKELVLSYKQKEREVLMAFVENPLKGYDFRISDNGKLLKKFDEEGREVFRSVQKLADADVQMLRNAYMRTEQNLSRLLADADGNMDSATRQMASRLSKVKTSIKKELNENGLLIDEKGSLSLRTADNTRSEQNAYDKEMQKAYKALLAGVEEYFTRQKQLVNQQYIDSEMTHEQHQQRMDEIQRQHLLVRSSMQKELVTGQDVFNEKEFLGSDAHVLDNFSRVKAWMPSTGHNFQAQVKADMEKGLNSIKELAIKRKEEIDAVLLDRNAFIKTARDYQAQLEKLGVFFMNTEGLAADDFKSMQIRASKVMQMLSQAAAETRDGSSETFRSILQSYQDVGDTMLTTQQQDGSLLLQGTRSQWQAIYAIIMGYNNDIDRQRVQMFEKNKSLLEKFMGQDDVLKGLSDAQTRQSDEKKRGDLYSDWGTQTGKQKYRSDMDAQMDSLDLEAQIYQRKWEMAQEFYNNRIAQEEDLAMRKELQWERDRTLEEMNMEFRQRQAESMRTMTELYMQEYDRRLEKANSYAEQIGEFAGVMASADWNSVEDRKKAGEEMLRFMAEETKKYIIEWVTRSVKRKIQEKIQEKQAQAHQASLTAIDQQGQTVRTVMSQKFGQAIVQTEGIANQASEAQNLAHNVTTAGQDMIDTQVSISQDTAKASGKILGELGPWGMPLVAVVTALLNMLLSSAMGTFSKAYGSAQNVTDKGGKRLADGMLTYAGGRYPVQGNDGMVYEAQYEPSLQTGIYQGGNGKAHFGIFSEQMPEMVVSGPTTRIISQDYPQLMKAIMEIDRHGRLRQSMPVFADGNLDGLGDFSEVDLPSRQMDSRQMAQLLREVGEVNRQLVQQLQRGVRASINMYGKGGAKESMDKADRFYHKNRIK